MSPSKTKKKLVSLKPPESYVHNRDRRLLQLRTRYLVLLDNRIDEGMEEAPIFQEGEVLTGTQVLARLNTLSLEKLEDLCENIDVQVMELTKGNAIRAVQVWSTDKDPVSNYYVELMEADMEENGILPPEGVKKLLLDFFPLDEIPKLLACKALDPYPGARSILTARLAGKL